MSEKKYSQHHKYAPLPEDSPRHKKKSKRRHAKSDHRHEYEYVAIDAHSRILSNGRETPCYYLGRRCSVCGRLDDVRAKGCDWEIPEGMPVYDVGSFCGLLEKYLADDRRVG